MHTRYFIVGTIFTSAYVNKIEELFTSSKSAEKILDCHSMIRYPRFIAGLAQALEISIYTSDNFIINT